MALDTRLPLAARVPNAAPALNQLLQAVEQGPALERRKLNQQQNQLLNEDQFKQGSVSKIQNAAIVAESVLPKLQSGDIDGAVKAMESFRERSTKTGVDLGIDDSDMEMIRNDPDRMARALQESINTNKRIRSQSVNPVTAPSAVREYEYFQKLNKKQQKQFIATKRAGFTLGDQRFGADTDLGGKPNVVVSADTVAKSKGKAAAGEAAGKAAIKQSNEAIAAIGKIRGNILNLDQAIQAIDDGAQTGALISKFPSIRESSIRLKNIRSKLGLDVVGAVTFGALSKGELDIALQTAMPDTLKPTELKKWLVDRKQAQEKLAEELNNAAIYLGTPGNTPAGYLEMRRNQLREQETNNSMQAGQQITTPESGGAYSVGQIIDVGGKQYRVIGGDMNDPEVELAQ